MAAPAAPPAAPPRARDPAMLEDETFADYDIRRGLEQPSKDLNYMEEQYLKYGNNLGNFHPAPIIGTNSMASVYKSDRFTPAENLMFYNYQATNGPTREKFDKYKPKGIDYKLHGDRFHQGAVLEDKERLVEYSRRHGTTSADQIRNQNRPDLSANEGNFSNTFLSSG